MNDIMNMPLAASIAESLKATYPELYTTLEQLVDAGEPPADIIAQTDRLAGRDTLTAHAIATTVEYLHAIQTEHAPK